LVSGSGNVAQYAAEKLIQLGAVVLTLSDSTGYVYEKDGFTMEQVHQVSPRASSLGGSEACRTRW
jgi:glutamate dehydrogenase (NADP+)